MVRGNPHSPKGEGRARLPASARSHRTDDPGAGRRREVERPADRAGGLDRLAGESADRARDGQPRLAISLRPRDRADGERFRQSGRRSRRIRNCSTGWRASSSTGGWKLKRHAPAHHAVERLPDVVGRADPKARDRRSGERPVLAVRPCAGWTAEEIRDSILAVSGIVELESRRAERLSRRSRRRCCDGQSMPGSGWGKSPPDEANRRSVYVHVKRSLLVPMLECLRPAPTPIRAARCAYTTTVPTQALGHAQRRLHECSRRGSCGTPVDGKRRRRSPRAGPPGVSAGLRPRAPTARR